MPRVTLSNADYRVLKRILENRNNNNGSPRTRARPRGGVVEKTKFLNSNLRRVYYNTSMNRRFVYVGQPGRETRRYNVERVYQNNWNMVRRISGTGGRARTRRTPREEAEYRRGRGRAPPRGRGNYRGRY